MARTPPKKKSKDEQWVLLNKLLPGNLKKKRVMRLLDKLDENTVGDYFEMAAFRIILAGKYYGYTDTADVFAQVDGLSNDTEDVADDSRKTLSAKTLAAAANLSMASICNKRERSAPNTAKEKTASGKKNPLTKIMRYKSDKMSDSWDEEGDELPASTDCGEATAAPAMELSDDELQPNDDDDAASGEPVAAEPVKTSESDDDEPVTAERDSDADDELQPDDDVAAATQEDDDDEDDVEKKILL
jgi:hypothetical protein